MKLFQKIDQHRKLILFALFLFSFFLRVSLTYQNYAAYGTEGWMDSLYYLSYGQSFAEGDFFPQFGPHPHMVTGPVIPLFVAISQVITGDSVLPVLILNCLLGALLVFVLFYLGLKIINPLAGHFMALWSVFNLSLIRYNYQILKEPLVFLLIPLIILCLVNLYQKRNILLNLTSSSLIFAVLIHTDERFFVYTPVFLIFVYLALPFKKKIRLSLLWLSVLIVTMIPWTVRNYKEHNEIVILTPRTTVFTSKLWGTNFSSVHFGKGEESESEIARREEDTIELYDRFGKEPRQYRRYEKYIRSFIHYWQPVYFRLTYIQYGFRPVKWSLSHNMVHILFYGIFLPFYLLGIIYSLIKRNWLILFLATLPVIHSLLHAYMIWPIARYRWPMVFLIVLVALWYFFSCILKNQEVAVNKAESEEQRA